MSEKRLVDGFVLWMRRLAAARYSLLVRKIIIKEMKRYLRILMLAAVCLAAVSCGKKPFFSDRTQWEETEAAFVQKKAFFADGRFFTVFDEAEMDPEEREAMTFLYAYMPLSDITDYEGEFYLGNVRMAFKVWREMPWGKDVPEKEFRHFVLPIRVNNENLDSSRWVFYDELAERVKGLSMYDAVLEVNHWCHEKAIYTPSDARTSSPLATVKTAYGRCGEESTFLVAALRSVGIPARQVYTPRWAHTDDNHAWVEAYVDGQWHFLGACEPEPVLDLAWFNDPVARGMLMHTKVFGLYPGPEEIMQVTPCYTEINVIDTYAEAAQVRVRVLDRDGEPVAGIPVEFKLYNYAEFYTVATKTSDEAGMASLSAGKGDMLVWAAKEGLFGFRKVSFGKDSVVDLVLEHKVGDEFSVQMDIVPPVEKSNPVKVSAEQRAENNRRLLVEDSIRHLYVATFYTAERAAARCLELGVDTAAFVPVLVGSRGNHAEIDAFMEGVEPGKRAEAVAFLRALSEKDWRDASCSVLRAHFDFRFPCWAEAGEKDGSAGADVAAAGAGAGVGGGGGAGAGKALAAGMRRYSDETYLRYVMNPRVEYEMLTPYKQYFAEVWPEEQRAEWAIDPSALLRWMADSIRIENDLNLQAMPMSPQGVYEARVADLRSYKIFLVSVLRSMGVAAQLHPVTGKVEYALQEGRWQGLDLGTMQGGFGGVSLGSASGKDAAVFGKTATQGKLQLFYRPLRTLPNPQYYSHFTLSCYEDGRLQLQTYPEGGSSWKNLFALPHSLPGGYYLLVSGTRLADGSVLANLSFVPVEKGRIKHSDLVMRDDPSAIKVIGSFNSENKYFDLESRSVKSVLETTGRGYFALAVLGAGEEPTNHALRDLARLAPDLEAWGRTLLLLFPDEASYQSYLKHPIEGLPSTVRFGIDQNGLIEKELVTNLRLSEGKRPVFVVGDTFNRVVYASQGYNTSLGTMLERLVREL